MSDDSTQSIIISMLEKLTEKVNVIAERLAALEAKQYDTRPIWQAVEGRLERVEARLDLMNDKLDVLDGGMLTAQADILGLKRRVNDLEEHRA